MVALDEWLGALAAALVEGYLHEHFTRPAKVYVIILRILFAVLFMVCFVLFIMFGDELGFWPPLPPP
ncbi:MAG TPA: hypothetical protein VEY95_06395 [Azospirillaceae bacterium]|nr:hypothetical protein [Azospirillaceae bacterium]